MSGFKRREFLKTISLATLVSFIGCEIFIDRPNLLYKHYKKGKDWFYYDYKINIRKKDRNKIKNNNFFPKIHPLYLQDNIYVKDSSCKKIDSLKFVNRSINQRSGISYVKKNLDRIIKDHKDGKISKSDTGLAEYAINFFWSDISQDKGNGKYTSELECPTVTMKSSKGVTIGFKLSGGDSRQTLGEFVSHNDKYLGDCDDFAIALLSSYEIMRNISSKNKGNFWEQLYYGLQRKQVIYAVETGHAINFVIDYNQKFSKAVIKPLEPQRKDISYLKQNCLINDITQLTHLQRFQNKLGNVYKVERSKIFWFYNSQVSYKLID